MPRIRELACEAGVSYVAMWKAVRRLVAQGQLSARRRRGVWVVSTSEASPSPPHQELPSQRPQCGSLVEAIARQLRTNITTGIYRPGDSVPSVKEAAVAWGVCPRTAQAAYRLALQQGTIVRERRQWLVPMPQPVASMLQLLIFTPRLRPQPMLSPSSYSQQVHHHIEMECGRRGVGLTLIEVDSEGRVNEEGTRRFANAVRGSQTVLGGSIVLGDGLSREGMCAVVERLQPLERPLAVLANTDDTVTIAEILRGMPRTSIFTVGNDYLAGRKVGMFLFRLGHRRLAYLSLFHHRGWSEKRLAGLRSVLEGTEPQTEVCAFLSTDGDQRPKIEAASYARLAAALNAIRWRGISRHRDISSFFHDALRRVENALLEQHRRTLSERLVRKALNRRDITAWVAGNDLTALLCLELLATHGIRVPRDLSLAAFDDTYAMSVHRLTSYHFDVASTARAIVAFAMDDGGRGGTCGARGGLVEPDGQVICRETTAKLETESEKPDAG